MIKCLAQGHHIDVDASLLLLSYPLSPTFFTKKNWNKEKVQDYYGFNDSVVHSYCL